MSNLRICFTVQGLAEDEHGNPAPAGMCIDFGASDLAGFPYEALVNDLDKAELLKTCFLDKVCTPEDVTFITPEEYDAEYGDEEDVEELTERDLLPEYDT